MDGVVPVRVARRLVLKGEATHAVFGAFATDAWYLHVESALDFDSFQEISGLNDLFFVLKSARIHRF